MGLGQYVIVALIIILAKRKVILSFKSAVFLSRRELIAERPASPSFSFSPLQRFSVSAFQCFPISAFPLLRFLRVQRITQAVANEIEREKSQREKDRGEN